MNTNVIQCISCIFNVNGVHEDLRKPYAQIAIGEMLSEKILKANTYHLDGAMHRKVKAVRSFYSSKHVSSLSLSLGHFYELLQTDFTEVR